MAVITNPVPGTALSQGVLAGGTQTLAVGTSATNGTSIAYNARWQWNLVGAESSANAGSNLQLQAIADDGFTIVATPISIVRSTGVVTIDTGSSIEFGDGSVAAPSIAPASNPASGIYFTTNAVNIAANGVQAAVFNTATTGVNFLSITPAATTVSPVLAATGSDTNVGLEFVGKGTGAINIGGTTAAAVYSLSVATVASQVEGLVITGAATGANATITAQANNVQIGSGVALVTTSTTGHLLIPTCAGTPTGVPVGHAIGNAAIILDTTGNKLWLYDNGTWKGVVVA